jgi:hypothetical protein
LGKPGKQQHREEYTAYDRALISAKREKQIVHFKLANDDTVQGIVRSVDKFNVELEIEASNAANPAATTCEWFSKVMIVRTRIEKSDV